MRNYSAWQNIRVNMDTLCAGGEPDTGCTLLGRQFRLPVFAGPVGAVQLHYGSKYDDLAYNDLLIPACREAGILAFTGDGTNPAVMTAACKAIGAAEGFGVPTVKPWDAATIAGKMQMVRDSGAFAAAMDIDAAGTSVFEKSYPRPQAAKRWKSCAASSRRPGCRSLSRAS